MTEPIALPNRAIALDDMVPHPRNYRSHPPDQITNLRESLKRFGQVRSIVVQDRIDGPAYIVAGHGIVQAARELSWLTLRADVLPVEWTDAQIEGYLIADNLHVLGAEDDLEQLSTLLRQQSDDWDLASLGSSDDELSAILASLAEENDAYIPPSAEAMDDFMRAKNPATTANDLRANTDRADETLGDDGAPWSGEKPINPLLPQSPTVLAGMGIKDIGTADQRLSAYNNSLIRQIMLVMDQEQYLWAVDALKRVMRARREKNHTELFLLLLREANDALPADAVTLPAPEEDVETGDEGDEDTARPTRADLDEDEALAEEEV